LNWNGSLDPLFTPVQGRLALAQALARRLSTPTGQLAFIGDDPDYGFDVRSYCNETVTDGTLGEIAAQVTAQCLLDERVETADCQVTAVTTAAGTVLTIALTITDSAGPFLLVLSVTSVTV